MCLGGVKSYKGSQLRLHSFPDHPRSKDRFSESTSFNRYSQGTVEREYLTTFDSYSEALTPERTEYVLIDRRPPPPDTVPSLI